MMVLALQNCDVFTGEGVISDGEIIITDGHIAEVNKSRDRRRHESAEVVDMNGLSIAPGYVDIQVNGGGDVLFNDDPTAEGLRRIVSAHRSLGTTSLVPTYITGPVEGMIEARKAAEVLFSEDNAAVLGVHFEGPAVSPEKLGVHDASHATSTFPLVALGTTPSFRQLVTLAPEVAGPGQISELVSRNANVSLGHSNASYEDAVVAIQSGARLATHLFNAMAPFAGRDPGIIGAVLADDRVSVDLIPDGFHLAYATLQIAWKAKPRGKCFFVTDAMPPVGGRTKGYRLGGLDVEVRDGRCVTREGTLAGSALDMATGVRNAVTRAGIPREEALRMASTYPAMFLGVDDRVGRVRSGLVANLIAIDNECSVHRVMHRGVFLR